MKSDAGSYSWGDGALALNRAETCSGASNPAALPPVATAVASAKKSSKFMRSFGIRLSRRRMSALMSAATFAGVGAASAGALSSGKEESD